MTLISGQPRTDVNIRTDNPPIASTPEVSVFCLPAVTQIGKSFEPTLITAPSEYLRLFGNPSSGSAEECFAALELGAKLRILPVYEIDEENVPVGVKATGTITVSANTITVTASEVGAGYNGFTFTVSAPRSGLAGVVDITVAPVANSPIERQVIRDIPVALSTTNDSVSDINQRLRNVQISISANLSLAAGQTCTLTSGATTPANITDVMVVEQMKSFEADEDGFYISPNTFNTPLLDAAILQIAENTKRFAILFVPHTLDSDEILDYRNGTGAYEHTPLNSFRATYFSGEVKFRRISNPQLHSFGSGCGDVFAMYARKDKTNQPWFSPARPEFGTFSNRVLSVKEFTSPQRDAIYDAGINFYKKTTNSGYRIEGNKSTFTNMNSPLSKANIGVLNVFLERFLTDLGNAFRYQPNDFSLFGQIFLTAKSKMDSFVTRRAMFSYQWLGDQNATSFDELQTNTAEEILAGSYKVVVVIQPTAANEYITFEVFNSAENTNININ